MENKILRKIGINQSAQVMLEFTFSMVVVFLMLFSTFMIFRWSGLDLAKRRQDHEKSLTAKIEQDYPRDNVVQGPINQLDAYFHQPLRMNAVFMGEI